MEREELLMQIVEKQKELMKYLLGQYGRFLSDDLHIDKLKSELASLASQLEKTEKPTKPTEKTDEENKALCDSCRFNLSVCGNSNKIFCDEYAEQFLKPRVKK